MPMTARIMLVAERPGYLGALWRMLEPFRGEWDVQACQGGATALRRLTEARYDVLVADEHVAETGADDLLVETRRRFPQVVRIALVGAADVAAVVRVVALAQRVLPKPCTAEHLHAAIRRAQSLRELLRSPALTAVVGRLGSIPTLSTVYTRLAEELAFPEFSLAKVGDLVAEDAGIAAKLMQVANSALMGLRRPACTPSQAVRVLGADLTRTLVLAADLFSRYDPATLKPFSIDALWAHSRRVAELAGEVAKAERAGERAVREAALAGLLHDIGRLMIASQLPGTYKEVLAVMKTERLSAAAAERELLGATHAEVGGYLLGQWGLPDGLVEAVAWHHHPSGCPGAAFSPLTAVHAAEALTAGDEDADVDADYLARLGLADRFEAWTRLPGASARV